MAASNYAAILTAIKENIEALAHTPGEDPGAVHDYQRWYITEQDFRTLFQQTEPGVGEIIHGWWISRIATKEELSEAGFNIRIYTFSIRGFMGLDDSAASEKLFQRKCENICNRFRSYPLLQTTHYGGTGQPGTYPNGAPGVMYCEPMIISLVNNAEVFGHLCHSAEIRLEVKEEIDIFSSETILTPQVWP